MASAETSYLKYLSFTGQIDLEWGMRAEMDNKTALTAAWRDQRARRALRGRPLQRTAARCSSRARASASTRHAARRTRSSRPASPTCRRAVLSHTSDFLAYTPNPPFQFGHIDFEGGGRVLMEFADTDGDELRVGTAAAHGLPHEGLRPQPRLPALLLEGDA